MPENGTSAAPVAREQPGARERPRAVWLLVLALVAGAVAYAGSLDGDFVYDDTRQILENHYLRSPAGIAHGMATDVWSFKGERGEAWSNYWRPVFVAWLGLQALLFGTTSTLPWHLASLCVHLGVTALCFGFARRLGLPPVGAGAVALLFSVHPVHAESVAWISGSPDLLAAAGLIAASTLWLDAARHGGSVRRIAALLAYALALGSKEIAVLLPPLVPLALWAADDRRRLRGRIWWHAVPFAGLAVLFLVARRLVLGTTAIELPWSLGPVDLVLTLPSVITFYLRQALWPVLISPAYPLRPVGIETAGMASVGLPLLIAGVFLAVAVWMARRDRRAAFAFAFFLCLLAPAMNLNAFTWEQLVHDRYLYLPLLGLLLAPVAVSPLGREPSTRRGRRVAATVVALAALAFTLRTASAARVWHGETTLWSSAVAADPASSHSWAQLGHALAAGGRNDDALDAFGRAIALSRVTSAYLGRADLLLERGRLEGARADLETVLSAYPDNAEARERLALVWQRAGRLDEAERVLVEGLRRAPYRACTFTVDLGVVHYLQGRKAEAVANLEHAATMTDSEPRAGCWNGLFHLGNLYTEMRRPDAARRAFASYLALSAPARDEVSRRYRELARRAFASGP